MSSKLGQFKASRIKLLIPVLLCLYPLALADYHYASHSGSNTYPYTSWETAADSITAAMNAASPYDTIYIAAGLFTESVWADPEDTALTFIGAGMDSTIITEHTTANMWLARNNTVAIDMCFLIDGNRTGFGGWIGADIAAYNCKTIGGYGMFPSCRFAIFENCIFENVYSAILADITGWLVFRNNYIKTNSGQTIMSLNIRNGLIENNIYEITGHNRFCLFSQNSSQSDTIIFRNNYVDNLLIGPNFSGPYRAEINNNTVRRARQYNPSDEDAFVISIGRDGVSAHFTNNAITESGTGILFGNYPYFDAGIYYNGFWNNVNGNYYSVSCPTCFDTLGNIEAFPMYANPDSYDVHLQAFSPFINAGDPLILDVDGSRSDVGVFGGPRGSYYQYQDLPPQAPDSLAYRISGDSLIISWRKNYETDFRRYLINRDTIPNFAPWAGNIVSEPDTNYFVDFNWDNQHNYYYKIEAYDNQGNLSSYSSELAVPITGINDDNSGVEIPNISAIESNYPNPFNSSTTIVYTVANLGPKPAQINIDIYDIGGRRIRGLLDSKEEVGRHSIIWDGLDDSGNALASGIYFAKITQWHVDYLSYSRKLVLVR